MPVKRNDAKSTAENKKRFLIEELNRLAVGEHLIDVATGKIKMDEKTGLILYKATSAAGYASAVAVTAGSGGALIEADPKLDAYSIELIAERYAQYG